MKEDYVFSYRIDGKVKRKVVLEKADVSLMLGGIAYARQRDSIVGRQAAYKTLMAALNIVVHGASRWNRRTI